MNKLMFLAFDCVYDCGGADILRILKFVFKLIDLVLFIVPVGLIFMIMLDFSKNVIAGKEDEMKKNVSMVVKRLIYCVVIFLVPTIVNFAVGLVSKTGDNIVAKASWCIDYAKNGDLTRCEVDYDALEPYPPYGCYVCEFNDDRDSIYVWDNETPVSNYGGCDGEFSLYPRLDSEERCNATNAEQCYKCKNGTGYVLSIVPPSREYEYNEKDSFNVTSGVTHCNPGFYDSPVEKNWCEYNPYVSGGSSHHDGSIHENDRVNLLN